MMTLAEALDAAIKELENAAASISSTTPSHDSLKRRQAAEMLRQHRRVLYGGSFAFWDNPHDAVYDRV